MKCNWRDLFHHYDPSHDERNHQFQEIRFTNKPQSENLCILPVVPRLWHTDSDFPGNPKNMSSQTLTSASIAEITKRIQQRQAKVGIIGLGYVGLPLALLYSEQKFSVTGFDIDERKISTLRQGGSY